jgi:predicted RNA binding protein YcfA (HicA-like mRNA interferase family)
MPKLPGVNHLDAVRALEKAGFRVRRQGKHIVMTDGTRIVTIPRHNPINAITKCGRKAPAFRRGDIRPPFRSLLAC